MSKRSDELFALAANADKIPEVLTGLRDEIKAIEGESEANKNKVVELTDKVNELRDTNMKLFLRETREVEDTPPEKTGDELFEELFTKAVMPEKEDK